MKQLDTSNYVVEEIPSKFGNISKISADKIFCVGEHAVHVQLQPLPNPRILWLNKRVMHEDPQFTLLDNDEEKYSKHLLAACGYIVAEGTNSDDSPNTIGHADRYGGIGIGNNGGSGRAAIVNGYLVKGIGKTPLIGVTANPMHASGGAYLEECVRESIFAEIIGMEFPRSAIPTIAIIDTGITQNWPGDYFGPLSERRVLLVRRCMLRPAHFERAPLFHSSNSKEGSLDFSRVKHVGRESARIFGRKLIISQLSEFFSAWSCQLAYAYIHRISPSGNSTSNICFDGQLLDFGACSALPSWAQINMIPGSPPTGGEFQTLVESAKSLSYYFGRCFDLSLSEPDVVNKIILRAREKYDETLLREALRVFGLSRDNAETMLKGNDISRLTAAINIVLSYYKGERFDIYSHTPQPDRSWDVTSLWDENPPSHLAPLKKIFSEIDINKKTCEARSTFLSKSRPLLYREELKSHLHEELSKLDISSQHAPQAIDNLMCKVIANSRRDTKKEISRMQNVGFAVASNFSIAIYKSEDDKSYSGVVEWASKKYMEIFSKEFPDWHDSFCLKLSSWTEKEISFGEQGKFKLECSVSLFE